MAGLNRIPWWRWIPIPWRKWSVVLRVDAADEIPDRLPRASAALVGDDTYPKWLAFDCPCRRGHRVMLNLDRSRKPYWIAKSIRPLTLQPSVNDFTIDTKCHYVVRDGRVKWAHTNKE
jgi:hypothetical protein